MNTSANFSNSKYTAKTPFLFNLVSIDISTPIIQLTITYPGGKLSRTSSNFKTSLHQHDYFEVVYVLSGQYQQIIEGKTSVLKAGECCILNRNIFHSELYFDNATILFMMLTDEALSPLIDKNFIYSSMDIYHDTFEPISHLILENQRRKYYTSKEYILFIPNSQDAPPESVNDLLDRIILSTEKRYPGYAFIVAGLLSRFFSILGQNKYWHYEKISLTKSNDEKLVEEITELLKNRGGHISRAELARITNYNADYLNRVIKRVTNMTLVEYRQYFSLQEAAYQIINTEKTIQKISLDLGFSNRNYFNKIFKKQFGMLPGEYKDHSHTTL